MDRKKRQWSDVWAVAARQHGVITRRQLLDLGYDSHAIQYRIDRRRLHPVWRGVYAVGRPDLTREGRWIAAVLACGPGAVGSHTCAAAVWEVVTAVRGWIEVTVAARRRIERPGIRIHRRDLKAVEITTQHGLPVTTPMVTLIDLGTCLERSELEGAINAADKRNLVDPKTLRSALDQYAGRPGVAALREILDRHTFTLTDSELERRFLPIARAAGLEPPLTQQRVNGFRVDFYWPDLGLVVETDGLRYHRTPSEQARDRLRDQAHTARGLTPLRFTHAQIRYDPRYVRSVLEPTVTRLRRTIGGLSGP
jgi:very-short-patch-repair endonuclease/predicted transcriptional regulator of viral defense system